MNTTEALFKIHAIVTSKSSKKEADKYIRDLVFCAMGELQAEGSFTPENFDLKIMEELKDHEEMDKKEVA